MRVLLAILKAEVARGGAERYTRDLAAALLRRGVAVATAATSFDADWPGDRCPIDAAALTRVGAYSRYLQRLDRLISERPFDVVHAMLPVLRCDVYHPHAGIAAETKRWGPMEHFNRRRRAMLLIERDLILGDDPPITLSLSNYVLRRLRSIYPGAPSEVVLNGTDLTRFDPDAPELAGARERLRRELGLAEDDFVVLSIAQDFERKGIPAAVKAVAMLQDGVHAGGAEPVTRHGTAGAGTPGGRRPVKLVIVGRDDRKPLQNLAEGLSAGSAVHFVGPVDDPRGWYLAADLFLLPSYHDPCSLVVIEALAMGLPVISTVFNGSCEYMTDGVHGRVLPDVEPRAIARAIAEYAGDAQRLATARAACLAMRPRLSAERHVDRVLAVYEKARLERVGR